MSIDYPPPPPRLPAEIRRAETLTREAFVDAGAAERIDVEAVTDAVGDAGVTRAFRWADADRDGWIAPGERSRLFTALDRFDRDGSYDSIRVSKDGAPLALGRILAHVGANSIPAVRARAHAPRGSTNQRLLEWYRQPHNYARVRVAVGGTRNMCAHFLTTALEHSGALSIPRDASYVGFDDRHASSVRAWAPSLARYLEREQGFRRIHDVRDMRPGDIAFTSGREGSYNHVYMIEGWVDQGRGVARVIDNQGFGHTRQLRGGPRSPTIYALRSPD